MCSIVAGFDTEQVRELVKLNAYRGTHSHSICYYDPHEEDVFYLMRSFGVLDPSSIDIPKGHFCITHQQAPTTDAKDQESIHPAEVEDKLLWHNGIVKENEVKRLQSKLNTFTPWDTKLILRNFIETGNVDEIDGSFSCVLMDQRDICVFRNEISPLYFTSNALSSTKFAGSDPVPENTILKLHFFENRFFFEPIKTFSTVENPYYFGD